LGSGNAVLENLALKKEALDEFDLPITVKGGFVFWFFHISHEKVSLANLHWAFHGNNSHLNLPVLK
jgi:hypothetical protein